MSESNEKWLNEWLLSRRRLLVFGSSAAAAAFLAACGGDDDDAGGGDTTPGDTTARRHHARRHHGATAPPGTTGATTGGTSAPAGGANAAQFGGGGGDGSIKIGFTAPLTGPLAGFGEANEFIMAGIEALVADGIMLGDKSYAVEFIVKDVQSNSDTAASQAGSLILEDGVDMMIAIATPEMINPVADQCEANGVPCLSTLAPWQPYFFGRGGDPAAGFDWTYHFFWGAEQLVGVFVDMWNSIETNKVVGLLCPNDPDGNALADPTTGFPAGVEAGGFTLVDPGRFQTGNADFSSVIGQFKDEGVEIVCGIPIPPDFATFWTQAKQQDFNPKVVTMAKAVLFSSAVEALGDSGNGLASRGVVDAHPPVLQLADGCRRAGVGRRVHGVDRQAVDAVRRVRPRAARGVPRQRRPRRQHRQAGVDRRDRGDQPRHHRRPGHVRPRGSAEERQPDPARRRSVAAAGRRAPFPFELLVVNNTQAPEIPVGGTMVPLEA